MKQLVMDTSNKLCRSLTVGCTKSSCYHYKFLHILVGLHQCLACFIWPSIWPVIIVLHVLVDCRIGKPTTCIGKNKGADQLCSNCTADQRLCFCYTDNTNPLSVQSASVTVQFQTLCRTWSVTQIAGFLMERLICYHYVTHVLVGLLYGQMAAQSRGGG